MYKQMNKRLIVWVSINDFEGLYCISSDGRVRNRHGKILKTNITHDGYHRVGLCKNSTPQKYYVHKLVAIHFLENPQNKPEADHISRDLNDNSVQNLRWATDRENKQNILNQSIHGHNIQYIPKNNNNPWQVGIRENGKLKSKSFATKQEAIDYRDVKLIFLSILESPEFN